MAKKIDIYEKRGDEWIYVGSTVRAKSCAEAAERYRAMKCGDQGQFKAHFCKRG